MILPEETEERLEGNASETEPEKAESVADTDREGEDEIVVKVMGERVDRICEVGEAPLIDIELVRDVEADSDTEAEEAGLDFALPAIG